MSAAGEGVRFDGYFQIPRHLHKLDASIALGGGVGGLRLKNENGVIMRLESRTQGLQLNGDRPVASRSPWSSKPVFGRGRLAASMDRRPLFGTAADGSKALIFAMSDHRVT